MTACRCMVLSPDILKNIAVNSPDEKLKQSALSDLALSSKVNGQREVMAAMNLNIHRLAGVVPTTKSRKVYDAKHREVTLGTLLREEGGKPSKDPDANAVFDQAGIAYDLFQKVFLRNSINDQGLRLDLTIHYGRNYDNAMWNGSQMIFGDGDGKLFNSFTKSLDVTIHELTHGVTQYEANLDYYQQPGALNESMSDVFGTIGKQWAKGQSFKQADWLIGAELLTKNVRGTALRSMKSPGTAYNDPVIGKDPQPDHMDRYVATEEDSGGVHINSGIPNRAFYLTCELLQDMKSWEAPGQIWYIALRDKMRRYTTFKDAAMILVEVAGQQYGARSKQQNAVRKAWGAVGINV